jgi:hypothetical protein
VCVEVSADGGVRGNVHFGHTAQQGGLVRWLRLLPGLLVLVAALALGTPNAFAASARTVHPQVLQASWFWQTAEEQANPPVSPGQLPATEPSGVPAGDLAVAHTSNDASSSKLTAVAFSLGAAARTGTTIDAFTVRLTLDQSSGAGNVAASSATVVACLPTRLWPAGAGADISSAPPVDCSAKVPAKVSGSTYTFELAPIAQQWVGSANLGVAFVNDPGNTQTPYQTVFTGAKSINVSMTYTPPPAPVAVTHHSSSGAAGSATTGSANYSGTATSPASVAAAPPPSLGATTVQTPPDASVPPQVAPATPANAGASAQRPAAKTAPARPSVPFWLAAAAIALLLAVAWAIVRDVAVPIPSVSTSRLGRALLEQRRARVAAPSTLHRGASL